MARKRVIEAPSLKSWEDVNDALRQVAEAQIALNDIESDMQKQIVGAKKVAEEQSKPYKDAIARLEHELKDFVSEHRSDMGKNKSIAVLPRKNMKNGLGLRIQFSCRKAGLLAIFTVMVLTLTKPMWWRKTGLCTMPSTKMGANIAPLAIQILS